jgi:hypothetical protein
MTTVIIDEKSKKRRIVLDIIKELGIGKIINEKSCKKSSKLNKDTLLAIKDFIEENAVKCDDYKDYLEKVV